MWKFDKYTRSKVAYCLRTASPFMLAQAIISLYVSALSYFHPPNDKLWFFGGIVGILAATWVYCARGRWFSNQVTIPCREFLTGGGIDPKLQDCVHLSTISLTECEGIPVLSYNTNNYIGGGRDREGNPLLIAQFLHRYFPDGTGDDCSFDYGAFCKCYQHPDTMLYGPDGKALWKEGEEHPEPSLYVRDCKAAADSWKTLPKGSVLLLRLPEPTEGDTKPRAERAVLLCNTWVEDGGSKPKTDTGTMQLSLQTLWKVAQEHLDKTLYLPLLGTGNSHWKESRYCAIWMMVNSFRSAHQGEKPDYALHICITPEEIREMDVRMALRLMSYALCG